MSSKPKHQPADAELGAGITSADHGAIAAGRVTPGDKVRHAAERFEHGSKFHGIEGVTDNSTSASNRVANVVDHAVKLPEEQR